MFNAQPVPSQREYLVSREAAEHFGKIYQFVRKLSSPLQENRVVLGATCRALEKLTSSGTQQSNLPVIVRDQKNLDKDRALTRVVLQDSNGGLFNVTILETKGGEKALITVTSYPLTSFVIDPSQYIRADPKPPIGDELSLTISPDGSQIALSKKCVGYRVSKADTKQQDAGDLKPGPIERMSQRKHIKALDAIRKTFAKDPKLYAPLPGDSTISTLLLEKIVKAIGDLVEKVEKGHPPEDFNIQRGNEMVWTSTASDEVMGNQFTMIENRSNAQIELIISQRGIEMRHVVVDIPKQKVLSITSNQQQRLSFVESVAFLAKIESRRSFNFPGVAWRIQKIRQEVLVSETILPEDSEHILALLAVRIDKIEKRDYGVLDTTRIPVTDGIHVETTITDGNMRLKIVETPLSSKDGFKDEVFLVLTVDVVNGGNKVYRLILTPETTATLHAMRSDL